MLPFTFISLKKGFGILGTNLPSSNFVFSRVFLDNSLARQSLTCFSSPVNSSTAGASYLGLTMTENSASAAYPSTKALKVAAYVASFVSGGS